MNLIIQIIHVVMLLGAIQGFIFGGIAIFSKKYKSKSNFFLGLLLITFSYNILQNYLVVADFFTKDEYFLFFYINFAPVFLPLYYLYVKFFLYPNAELTKWNYLLFLPISIVLVESIFEKIGFATGLFHQLDIVMFDDYRRILEVFTVIFTITLLILVYRMILNFEKTNSLQINLPKIRLRWLKIFTIILLILAIYWTFPLYFELQTRLAEAIPYFYLLWIGLAVTIYLLGHVALYQFGISEEQINLNQFISNQKVNLPNNKQKDRNNAHIIAFEKYIKEEKNFLNSLLSLDSVAENLGLNSSYLSRILNAHLDKNFTDYVNELRVEEAKIYLLNPEFSNYTLVSIGLEAGFNSKSSFNAVFKKMTGMTPSEYRKKQVAFLM